MTNSIQMAALLLERTSVTRKRFEDQYRKTGMSYNIFKVAGISEREVIMCRVLADLLDPKGLHYRGSIYLKLFMDMVKPLVENTGKFDPSKARITTEYTINEDRRIDIVLDDGTVFIPIEVKIGAGEQEKQLADYADYSRRINTGVGFIPVLFLTPDGHKSGEAPRDDYVPISFEKHIVPWLVQCLNLEETDKATPIREILKQFIKAIKLFCGHMEDEAMEKAIKDLIAGSRESYEAALRIYKAVDELNFDRKVYEIFRDQICNCVKNKLSGTEYVKEDKDDDAYLDIPIGNGCRLYINYNLKSLSVESINKKKQVAAEAADKIGKIMSRVTGAHSEDWGEDFIWANGNVRYPGLKDLDDDGIYNYELYQIYSKDPQSVADRIVSVATDLKDI